MKNPQPEPIRIYITILFGFVWLMFLALWLFFYAGTFSLIQNIGVFIGSLVVIGAIMVLLWVPWSFKHAD
ncbi:MAG TPA: hypothetical protein VK444_04480 [Methanobacteriaceae archaeon]|nr:hypothetical protein [Methanobacteriaceae archaeon]